jgi:hypothetical protein
MLKVVDAVLSDRQAGSGSGVSGTIVAWCRAFFRRWSWQNLVSVAV